MGIDATALAETVEAPKVKIGRYIYTGRILSIEQWAGFEEQLQRVETMTVLDQVTFAREFLRAVFPKKALSIWKPDPVPAILANPKLWDILSDFFASQLRVTGLTDALRMKMSGL